METVYPYYHSVLVYLQNNTGHVLFWICSFLVILVLFVLWLSARITANSSAKALDLANMNIKRIDATQAKLEKLERYLEDVFQKDVGAAMRNFDQTVSSVLTVMREDLGRGITQIEKIEAAVKSRQTVDTRVVEGVREARSLLGAPVQAAAPAVAPGPQA